MEYTAPHAVSRGLAAVSPTHGLIASANGNVLTIYDVPSDTAVTSLTTAGPVSHLAWSENAAPGAAPILAAASKPGGNVVVVDGGEGTVLVDVHDGKLEITWMAVIAGEADSFVEGGRLVLGYEYGIGVAVFNYMRGSLLAFIPFATRVVQPGMGGVVARVVSPCDSMAALVLRDSPAPSDVLLIISLHDGQQVATCNTPGAITRVTGVRWVGMRLIVWGRGSYGEVSNVVVLLAPDGQLLSDKLRRLDGDDGDVAGAAGRESAGVRAIASTEASDVVAIGCDDGHIRVVDVVAECVLHEFAHAAPQIDADYPPFVFRERRLLTRNRDEGDGNDDNGDDDNEDGNEHLSEHLSEYYDFDDENNNSSPEGTRRRRRERRSSGGGGMSVSSVFDVVAFDTSVEIGRAKRADGTTGNALGGDGRPRRGVAWLDMSRNGRYIASRDEGMPHVVMIWDVARLRLKTVLILEEVVLCARWSHAGARLAVACGAAWVYLWDGRGAAAVRVEAKGRWFDEFGVRRIAWSANDEALLLIDGLSARAFMTMYVT